MGALRGKCGFQARRGGSEGGACARARGSGAGTKCLQGRQSFCYILEVNLPEKIWNVDNLFLVLKKGNIYLILTEGDIHFSIILNGFKYTEEFSILSNVIFSNGF